MLMGISEKQFYTSSSGLSVFKTMEHDGKRTAISDNDIEDLCIAINAAINIFLDSATKATLANDLYDLPLMTLGIYADGV